MSIENKNSKESFTLTNRGKTARNIAVTALTSAAAIVSVNHIAHSPEVTFTGTQEVPAEHGTNLTEMVRENVDYSSNEVPTEKIVNYVIDTNQKMLTDGLDAGEKPIFPESATLEK